MHTFCALVGGNHSSIVDYTLSVTGLINHLQAKDMNKCTNVLMSLHVALSLISKQAHLITTAEGHRSIQYIALVYLHIGVLQL
jgi:hypothetical protein